MSFLKNLDKDLNTIYNNQFIKQDIETAKEISEIYLSKNLDKTYKFYLEGIFLGVTDRTAAHPYLVRVIEAKPKGLMNKLLGFQGGKINYEFDNSFNLDHYLKSNWVDPILETYKKENEELITSKNLYISSKISFFDYFIKRLNVYDIVQPSEHIRHYENIIRDKYLDILRSEFRLILR